MNYIYRYTDTKDGMIKYVGIVCRVSDGKEVLLRRFNEHANNEWWLQGKSWRIEYIEVPTKNDALSLEGHYIAKYKTNEWYNKAKSNVGMLSFLNFEFNWSVLKENIFVKEREIKEREARKIYIEVDKIPYIVSEKLAEVSKCIRIIDDLLFREDYSRFSKENLLEDKEELENRKKVLINYQLGAKLNLL